MNSNKDKILRKQTELWSLALRPEPYSDPRSASCEGHLLPRRRMSTLKQETQTK